MQSADSGDIANTAQQRPAEGERLTAPIHQDGVARLVTVGIGGGGTNAVNRMIAADVRGVEFLAVNTDAQALEQSRAANRLRIGERLTRGLGAGGNPEIGRKAAEESYGAIREALTGADMVFITAGMGGGTGTGAAPLVAQAAREQGALTVAIVTTPFAFERRRKSIAERGVAALREIVDALIVVPNERLMQLAARDMSAFEAYRLADDVLRQGIQGISDLIMIPGLINLDFADIYTVMADAGSALMSIGQASGENRAEEAARGAITNPLLDVDISGARGVVFNITGGDDLTMFEVNRVAEIIAGAAHQDANIIFGTAYDQGLAGSLKVTVVATGFEPRLAYGRPRQPRTPTSASLDSVRAGTSGQTPISVSPNPLVRKDVQEARLPETPVPAIPPAAPDRDSYVRVGSPPRQPEDVAVPPLRASGDTAGAADGHEAPRPQRTDEQVRLPRQVEPGQMDGSARRATDQRDAHHALVARGYHGDEYVENDEPEELELPRETRHGWERLFNVRR